MIDRTWYFLTVVPQSEFETADKLHRLGAETLVPIVVKDVRVARHKLVERRFPLWPGYVAAGFSVSRPWYQIEHVSTITGALGWDGEPYQLPAETVRMVAETAAKPLEIRMKRDRASFRVGDKVKLLKGPFMHHIAEVSAVRKKSAEIFLELFGSIQGVSIPLDAIEQAAA